MQLEVKKYLYDVRQAALLVEEFIAGKTISSFETDTMLRSAVERQFEIMGEAMTQLARLDVAVAERISDYRRIIAFRNILIHGYAQVDYRIVWGIAETKLRELNREVSALLEED